MSAVPKVIVTHRVHDPVKKLLSAHCELVANDGDEIWPQSKLISLAAEAVGLMAFMPDRIDAEFLDACPKLRVIAAALQAADNIDVAACTGSGVWVTVTPDLSSVPTAELALALTLGLIRNVLPGDRLIRSRKFQGWRPVLFGSTLTGKTIGIVGMGKLGQAFARLLSGFSIKIIYHDPAPMSPVQEAFFGMARATFEEVLSQSDVVVLTVPLNSATLRLIDEPTLAKMKPGAHLVNAGRGSVVDEEAVSRALNQGQLAGYAADVFAMEDRTEADHPSVVSAALIANPDHTLLTPHLGASVDEVRLEIEISAARNILQALRGERPQDAVNEIVIGTG